MENMGPVIMCSVCGTSKILVPVKYISKFVKLIVWPCAVYLGEGLPK